VPRVTGARDLTAAIVGIPGAQLPVSGAQVQERCEPRLREIHEQTVDEFRFEARGVRRVLSVEVDVGVQRVLRGHARALAPREQTEDRTLDADALVEPLTLG
jgi:hypothetical protein